MRRRPGIADFKELEAALVDEESCPAKQAPGRVFRRGHSGSIAVVKEEAVKFFDAVLHTQCEPQEQTKGTAKAACDEAAFEAFLATLLPTPARPVTAKQNAAVERAV